MSDIISFTPLNALDAQANLRDFIDLCRNHLKPFGVDNNFDQDIWEITGLAGKAQRTKAHIYFSKLTEKRVGGRVGRGKNTIISDELLMRDPFRSFTKAMLTYLHGLQPTTGIHSRFDTFRYLEAALFDQTGEFCPTATTPQVLNHATTLLMKNFNEQTAYERSMQLELIYRFMVQLRLVTTPSTWRSSLPRSQYRRIRVGKEFDEERTNKLPNPVALEALASIFTSTTEDAIEIITSSICAILLCSPDRITEVLYLPLDCLIPDWKDPDTGELGTGLRWFPLKGAAPMTKTVIPSMADIAKRAVDQLRRVSEKARIVAHWYEANPDKLYLPERLEYLRDKDQLSVKEIELALYDGKCSNTIAREWIKSNNLQIVRNSRHSLGYVAFQAVEKAVIASLPKGFPIMDAETGMRFSEALCISRPGEFNAKRGFTEHGVAAIQYHTVQDALRGTRFTKTIFEKRGLTDVDGSPLFIKTHMLRHYLNTLVRQDGKLTEEEIAKWSGRKNVGQNKVYNHVSDKDMLAHIRKAVGDPKMAVGPLSNIDNRIFISRDEFANLKIVTAHTTEFGYCPHDFTMLPCQIHGDCINCNEQVCVKGDAAAEANLRKMQKETSMLLKKAQEAMDENDYGANEWVKHQTLTLKRVEQLISILDDPTVPAGAVIQLSGVVPASRLAQAAEQRQALSGAKSISQTIQSIDDVRALLTGATAQ